SAVLQSGFR
nr:Chain B, SER-ALA-VAL-LEU-GLN-SER-GLY-PHE [Severe acute respiratory syndrome coronavirus 2]